MKFCHLHNHSTYCLSGDTLIYNCNNHSNRGRIYRSDSINFKSSRTIKELYIASITKKRGYTEKKYPIKVFDFESKTFVKSKIKNIVFSGKKFLYEITTSKGKKIKASKHHYFLTSNGWKKLKDLKTNSLLACNGKFLFYEEIKSIRKIGVQDTYDIQVVHKDQNFIANGFVVHNSKLDGFGHPKDYVEKAEELGFKYLAITDHGNIDGLIKFQQACKDSKVKPIFGCEAYLTKNFKSKINSHISIWIKNERGFKNLCKMLSIANLNGFYRRPRIDFKTLIKYRKGLVFGTACLKSFVRMEGGEEFFEKLKSKVGNDLYIEIMPHDTEAQVKHNRFMVKLGKRTQTKIIATNDCHYPNKKDHLTQEMMLAIQSKTTWNDPKRFKFDIKGLHLKTAEEMKVSLKKIGFYKKEYLTNTYEIAKKCSFKIEKQEILLPIVPGVEEGEENKKLWELCFEGYEKIFKQKIIKNDEYYNRLREEYLVIKHKNFSRYFLLVWELCNWCRSQGILIGPGRGSVGGSLIAFLLGITSVDPIKHKLLFSRFISEDRIDYPDIDIDFEDTKRHLIKQHLEEIYGEGNIAGVSSFNKIKARAAIQDVARVFDVPPIETNAFTKFFDETDQSPIPEKINNTIREYPECKAYAEKYPKVIKYAKRLGGQIRQGSQHAAALIVSMEDIATGGRCNLMERNRIRLINWEKDDAEYMGLMKLDALGLKLLSILSNCLKLIKENHNKDIKLEKLNIEDKAVLKEISKGNNVGVFQLNTWAMTSLIKNMGIEEFRHIADSVALVRPGPMNSGMTKQYIERKHGKTWKKMHPVYEELTKDTYGVILFQEQIMEVIYKVAGLPYSTADKIRKIIGKKRDVKEFDKYEDIFIKGCKKTKIISEEEAKEFWIGLHEHSRYSFNLSHSVEYAMLAYWCAWLKYYFPTEFICASLSFGDEKKKPELIEEAYRLGLTLQLPKININDPFEWKAVENKLLIPFVEIKGVGKTKAVQMANYKFINKSESKNISKFFTKKKTKQAKPKQSQIEKMLLLIEANNPTQSVSITDEVKDLFKFRIVGNPKNNYPKLYSIFNNSIRLDRLDDTLNGESKELKKLGCIAKEISFNKHDNLFTCKKCSLEEECKRPVPPSPGKLNIAIVGEAPGKKEDEKGKGFIGSGDKIWKSIKYNRSNFHITNVVKCFPSKSRKPNKKQIKICGECFLDAELKQIKPCLILAFGNTSLQFFENKTSGIVSMSGKTTWSEKYGCWIAWCIHPAAIMHNPENEAYYKTGMKNFKRLLKILAKGKLEK